MTIPSLHRQKLSELIFGIVLGTIVSVILISCYVIWFTRADTVVSTHGGTEQVALEFHRKSGTNSKEESELETQSMNVLISTIRNAESKYDDVGLRSLNLLPEMVDNEDLLNALVGVILNRSIDAVGFEESFNQLIQQENSELSALAINKLLEIWVRIDPDNLLSFSLTVESTDMRELMQRTLLESWVVHEPQRLREQLHLFDPNVRVVADIESMFAIATVDPDRAIHEFLPKISGSGLAISYFREIVRQLAGRDYQLALQFVDEHIPDGADDFGTGVPNRLTALSDVFRIVAETDPTTAIQAAARVSSGEGLGPEISVIGQLIANDDLTTALSLLPQVREGPTQSLANEIIGLACVRSGMYDKAMALSEDLPISDRERYYVTILRAWSKDSPSQLIEALPSLPVNLRSLAVFELNGSNSGIPLLSQSQLDSINSLISEQERSLLAKGREEIQKMRLKQSHVKPIEFIELWYDRADERMRIEGYGWE